jgi:AcrR family transcriptional regulator
MTVSLADLSAEPLGRESTQQYRTILRHALKHFSRRGYVGSNVRAIAADAGMSAPMINYYFKTKEALYSEVVRIVMATLEDLVWGQFPAEGDFETQARHLIAQHVSFGRTYHEALGLILGIVYGPPEGRASVDLPALYGRTILGIRQVVLDAVQDGRLALKKGVGANEAVRAMEDAINRATIRCWEDASLEPQPLMDSALKVMLRGLID